MQSRRGGSDSTKPVFVALVVLLVAVSTVGGALSGVHPTATMVVDPLYGALFAGLVALAASVSGRLTWLWLAMWSVALARETGLLVAAGLALTLAFGSALRVRSSPVVGAAVGGLGVQVVLRWPPIAFHGSTAVAGTVAVAPCLVHALLRLAPRARRWVVYGLMAGSAAAVVVAVPAVVEMVASRSDAAQGISATDGALTDLRQGQASSGSAQLVQANLDFAATERRVGAWWTSGVDLLPVVAQQRRAVVQAVDVARQVAGVTSQQASHIDYSKLHDQAGTIDLAEVRALGPPLHIVEQQLALAQTRLASVRSAWLVGPLQSRFDRVDRQVAKADSSASLADEALAAAPGLLGGDGPRTYLVGLLDSAESRGLGGLLVWYWELKVDEGHLSVGPLGDANEIRGQLTAMGGGRLTGPADYLARYGQFDPQETFIDTPYSPDLPTVTQVTAQLYADAGHPHIDGMLVLDPHAIAALLQLTGPVEVPQVGQLDAGNIEQFLDSGEYSMFPGPGQQDARRQVLHDAMQVTAGRFVSSSLPGPQGLADAFGADVHRGDIGFWSLHPSEQPFLRRTGLADAFPAPDGGDLLGVTTQNAVNNKIDTYLHRTITADVVYDRVRGQVADHVSLSLTNSAPSSGLSYYVIDPFPGVAPPPGNDLPEGANLTWVTLYSPLRLASATVGNHPFQVTTTPELGVYAYSGWVEIDSGATQTVGFDLQGRLAAGGAYHLTVYQQPTVNPDRTRILFAGASSREVPSGWSPPAAAVSNRYFK